MANWSRFPLTHFEKWANAIRGLLPKFFEEEEPNFQESREKIESLKHFKNLPKKAKEKYLNISVLMYDWSLARAAELSESGELKKKVGGMFYKSADIIGEAIKEAENNQDESFPDGKTPRVQELLDRAARVKQQADKIKLKSKYVSNELYDSRELLEETLIFLHDFNWCGRKLFRIEEQLTNELMLTQIDGVNAEFFKLPFQTICVHLPFNQMVRIREKLVQWCYVSEYAEDDGRHIHVMYVNEEGYPFFHEFILDDNKPLGVQIKEQIAVQYGKEAAKEHMAIFSMIAAMMLYMNSSERDVRMMSPTVVMPKQDSRLPVCSVGGTIRVDRTLYVSSNEDGTHSTNTIHILKWTVRGHFRNQAHGKDMKERKIIWVRPYLKGKERKNEEMPVSNKEYIIDP